MGDCHRGREPAGWGEWLGVGPWLLFSITGDWGRADSKGICTSSKGEEAGFSCVYVLGDEGRAGGMRESRREGKGCGGCGGVETLASAPGFDVETEHWPLWLYPHVAERPHFAFNCITVVMNFWQVGVSPKTDGECVRGRDPLQRLDVQWVIDALIETVTKIHLGREMNSWLESQMWNINTQYFYCSFDTIHESLEWNFKIYFFPFYNQQFGNHEQHKILHKHQFRNWSQSWLKRQITLSCTDLCCSAVCGSW